MLYNVNMKERSPNLSLVELDHITDTPEQIPGTPHDERRDILGPDSASSDMVPDSPGAIARFQEARKQDRAERKEIRSQRLQRIFSRIRGRDSGDITPVGPAAA